MEIAAVETIGFFEKKAEPIQEALMELLQLPVRRVVLVYDRKSKMGSQLVRKVRWKMLKEFQRRKKQLSSLQVDVYDTALRWRLGIIEALKDEAMQAVFVFPGDMDPNTPPSVREEQRRSWKRMLKNAHSNVLILGDYSSQDPFKTKFDKLIGHHAIEMVFPDLAPQMKALGHSKYRTEFFIIGRAVFEQLEQEGKHWWGTDPTPQLTLSALGQKSLRVMAPIQLGEFADNPEHRHLLGQKHQILRYVFQFTIDRLISDMLFTDSDEEQLKKYVELDPILSKLFTDTMRALRVNLVPEENLTMVVWANKQNRFRKFFESILGDILAVRDRLGLPSDVFKPYRLEHLHITILGLEIIKLRQNHYYNANFLINNGQLHQNGPPELRDALLRVSGFRNPLFTIRFGGFPRAYCLCNGKKLRGWRCISSGSGFHSYGRSAYEGSFYGFRGGPAVLTGWPVKSRSHVYNFTRKLYLFRRTAETYGFLDKYHLKAIPYWRDDDLYVRIGTFGAYRESVIQHFVEEVRTALSKRKPITVDILLDDLSIVYYKNTSLNKIIAEVTVTDALRKPELLDKLYDRWSADH